MRLVAPERNVREGGDVYCLVCGRLVCPSILWAHSMSTMCSMYTGLVSRWASAYFHPLLRLISRGPFMSLRK